ncbi:MAG: DUF4375 domain-containing protein [Verrucomicrobiota bacterium]
MKYSAKAEILETDDDAQLAWDAIEPVWDDFPVGGRFNAMSAYLDSLSSGQRSLLAIDWCQKEIRNGGMIQLFGNSTGNLVPQAIEGFRTIGAKKYADILTEASQCLGSPYPQSGNARKKAYSSLDSSEKERIEELDGEFLKLLWSDSDDLEPIRAGFVRQNCNEFIEN